MAETLEGKVVLITGSSGRIGLGMAQAFHAAGALVALGDLHQDTVERAAADLGGKRTFAGVVDVRDEASMRRFLRGGGASPGPGDDCGGQRRRLSDPRGARHGRSRNGTA